MFQRFVTCISAPNVLPMTWKAFLLSGPREVFVHGPQTRYLALRISYRTVKTACSGDSARTPRDPQMSAAVSRTPARYADYCMHTRFRLVPYIW